MPIKRRLSTPITKRSNVSAPHKAVIDLLSANANRYVFYDTKECFVSTPVKGKREKLHFHMTTMAGMIACKYLTEYEPNKWRLVD